MSEGRRGSRSFVLGALVLLAAVVFGGAQLLRSPAACPEGMRYIPGGTHVLGDDAAFDRRQTVPEAGITRGSFVIEAYCVAVLPFPGQHGAPWPVDGLNARMAARLDRVLAEHGRRLCTVTELLLASAGPANWQHPTGPGNERSAVCEPDDANPASLGSHPDCVSPMGLQGVGVRSTWARLDGPMRQHLARYGAPPPPPWANPAEGEDSDYAVYGGTARDDTFYRPNNFGIHTHQGLKVFNDDGARVCAAPGRRSVEAEEAYQAWLAPMVAGGRFAELLSVD